MLFEGAFANLHAHAATKVDLDNDERAPLLFIGFGEDHICPPKAKGIPGRPHFPGPRCA